jgi:DNA polymerase III delta prime subunit
MELLFHKSTKEQLEHIAKKGAGIYLFWGEPGTGKTSAAHHIARGLLQDNIANIKIVKPEGKSITIEQIHQLRSFLHLKPSKTNVQFIIVTEAQKMTIPAQNAFLKALEEAPASTFIILIATTKEQLLPTITSRCMSIYFALLQSDEIEGHLIKNHKLAKTSAQEIALISKGSIATAINLATDSEFLNEQKSIYNNAHSLITGSLYERLQVSSAVFADKNTNAVLAKVSQILEHKLRQKVLAGHYDTIGEVTNGIRLCDTMRGYISNNGNPKFALDRLAIEISI